MIYICRIQNPDTPQARLVMAASGTARQSNSGHSGALWSTAERGGTGPGGTVARRSGAPRGRTTISTLRSTKTTVLEDLSNPKPGHTTGGSGRGGARRSNGAARGWIGRDAVRSIRQEDNPRSCPPANREHSLERLFGSTNSLIRT